MSSFSPIIRVRKLLDKMKSERGDQRSPRLHNKRFHSRNTSDDININSNSNGAFSSPNIRPKKSAKSTTSTLHSLELTNESLKEEIVVGDDQFMYLPIEATLLIFSFLEREELESIRLVSKLWNELSDDEGLWKLLCIQDWNVHNLQDKTWKKTYRRLNEVLNDGVWEGMSKWLSPVGFDNEQRTTARLNFQKRTSRLSNMNGGLSSPMSSPAVSSKSEIHRCASTTVPSQLTTVNSGLDASSTLASSQPTIAASGSSSAKEAELRVHGSGVTINCAAPSPFKIEGERAENDTSGTSFRWNKLFERHTSVYEGKINFADGSVSGTISYHDGSTHWKGEFHYKKMNRIKKYSQLNA